MKHIVKTLCHNDELETKYKKMMFYKEFKYVFDKVVTMYGSNYKTKVKDYTLKRLNELSVRLS